MSQESDAAIVVVNPRAKREVITTVIANQRKKPEVITNAFGARLIIRDRADPALR